MRKFRNNEEAFTGLEAAIVLIAFVVVAAVFSYVVLGAGFFTTQKSQEVIYAGVESAASNVVVKGDVYGIANSDSVAKVQYIQFDVGLAAGGYPIDVEQLYIIYSDTKTTPTTLVAAEDFYDNTTDKSPAKGEWFIAHKSGSDVKPGDHILKFGQTFTIKMNPLDGIPTREAFHIEIKPEVGASLAVSRTVPPSLTKTTLLT